MLGEDTGNDREVFRRQGQKCSLVKGTQEVCCGLEL